MKTQNPNRFNIPKYGLLATLTSLLVLYMGLVWHYNDTAHLGISGLFVLALGMMIYEYPKTLKFSTSRVAFAVGLAGVIFILSISTFLLHQQPAHQGNTAGSLLIVAMLRLLPALIAVSVGILAKGFAGIRYFWREEILLLALGLPGVLASFLMDISPLTAVFSEGLLIAGGFDVVRDGVTLSLPGGAVVVYYGCSGMESICYLLSLSVLFLLMFPVAGLKRWITPIVGIVLAFVINGFRVALMAILWADKNVERFDYWHLGEGSMIFGLIAVVAFSAFYMFVLQAFESSTTSPREVG